MQQNNGIDKKQMISFAVLCLVLFGFMFYFQNKQAKEEQLKAQQQKTEQAKTAVKPTQATNINPNVTPNAIQTASLGNNELKLEFSSLGGQVSRVELVKYKAYNHKTDHADQPLYLINKNNSNYGFQFKDKTGKVINTKDLVFSPTVNGNAVTLTADYNGAVIQFIYTLLPKYTLDFKVRTQGLSKITSDNKADFIWDYNVRLRRTERIKRRMNPFSSTMKVCSYRLLTVVSAVDAAVLGPVDFDLASEIRFQRPLAPV